MFYLTVRFCQMSLILDHQLDAFEPSAVCCHSYFSPQPSKYLSLELRSHSSRSSYQIAHY